MSTIFLVEIKILIERILNKDANVEDVNQSHALQLFSSTLKSSKDLLETQSRTAKLWIQYLNYIQIVKLFIHAERTGNWNLHLLATESMINLFAATGHLHYAKSARLYLQLKLALPEQYLWLYNKFAMEGYHTIRRSRRYWAGLWSDLVIEQVMMKSLKSRGGLTRGKGMTDSVRHQWVHTMHRCASVHNAMTILTDLGTKPVNNMLI